MTANDSADGVFGDIAAASATSAWNIVNFVMDKCGLTHAGANLQRSGNLGGGTGPLYASSFDPVSSRRRANARVATTQRRRLPKEDADQINKEGCQRILGRINAPWLPNKRYQKLQPPALMERRQSECPSPTTSSTPVAATWTSAPNATSTNLTMSCISTIPSSSDLATLIYATFILDHLKSNSNLELNLHKNLFRKFFYPQLISFLDNALSAQPHSYKSLYLVISSELRFLGF